MLGRRKNARVKINSQVRWQLQGGNLSGKAIVMDYSITGVKLLLDMFFEPPAECVLLIEPIEDVTQSFGLKKVKLKWYKKIEDKEELLQLGGDFIN